MDNVPYLSLSQVKIDADLVRLLPQKLAYYHLALPLAIDDGQLSLAIAHTDNPSVIEMFGKLLNVQIVPIHANPIEIRAALDQVWQTVKNPEPRILTWGDTQDRSVLAQTIGDSLGQMLNAHITNVQGRDLDAVLMLTQHDPYMLTVINAPISDDLLSFVRKAGTPVLLVHGHEQIRFTRILLSLRGHSPDLSALDLIIPLAQAVKAEMTVLAVTGASQSSQSTRTRKQDSLTALLDPQQEPAQHLAACTERLIKADLYGYLKLCQGNPVQQIASEFAKGYYPLLVITFEAYGDFVQQVIQAVQGKQDNFGILIVKPSLAP